MKYIEEKIINIIMKKVILNESSISVNPKTDVIEELNFDSLMYIETIADIESEFDVEFDEEDLDIEKLKTVGNFIDLVIKKVV